LITATKRKLVSNAMLLSTVMAQPSDVQFTAN